MLMLIRNDEFKPLVEVALTAAKAAGQVIMEIYKKKKQNVTIKSDTSPLTEADLASHKVIFDLLKRKFPTIPILSEENFNTNQERKKIKKFWLIDPLDGTKEFISKNGEFTVNIALIVDNYPLFGVVGWPTENTIFWGGANFGSFKVTSEKIDLLKVNNSLKSNELIKAVISRSHQNEKTLKFIRSIGQHISIKTGSSLKFCKVANGEADLYPRLAPTSEWDTAAAQAVVEGAGGYVFDLLGNRLHYGKQEILNPDFIASSVPFNLLNIRTNHYLSTL